MTRRPQRADRHPTGPPGAVHGSSAAQLGGLASLGAGAIHAAAAGVHAEHVTLSRLFVVTAVAQLVVGLVLLVRGGRLAAAATVVVNGVAVGAWLVTRPSGVSWIAGLETAEDPGFADTVCAAARRARRRRRARRAPPGHPTAPRPPRLGVPAVAIGAFTVVAMMTGATHVHSHGEGTAGHTHDDGATDRDATARHVHDRRDRARPRRPPPPRPGPGRGTRRPPIDFSGVPGVTAEQQDRPRRSPRRTIAELPMFADVTAVPAFGFQSIGDAATGFEHYINPGFIGDDHFLDPSHPESLVYRVDGDQRTLVSAMFIANDLAVDDPELVD